jgi:hypothetical protein
MPPRALSIEALESRRMLTFPVSLFDPVGIATDPSGDIHVNYDDVTRGSVVQRISPNGTLEGSGVVTDGSLAAVPGSLIYLNNVVISGSGVLANLLPDGELLGGALANGTVFALANLRSINVDTSHIYDVASGKYSNFGGTITISNANFGDVAQLGSDGFFVTGISNGLPFVMEVTINANNVYLGNVVAASSAALPGLQDLPRGVAVNQQGVVLTTLPINPDAPVDVPVTFSIDSATGGITTPRVLSQITDDPSNGQPSQVNGITLASRGIKADAAGNFVIAPGPVGTSIEGTQSGIVEISSDLTRVRFFPMTNNVALNSEDVAVSPDDQFAYVTVANPQFLGPNEVDAVPYTPFQPQLQAVGGFTATAGESGTLTSVELAAFTDPTGAQSAANYVAAIDWGDDSTTDGTVSAVGSTGGFVVKGSHSYSEEGQYTIGIVVDRAGALPATATSTATITDPAVSATGGFTLQATAGGPSGEQTVATFSDPGGAEPLADYSAEINWGDGDSSAGTISANGGTFTVLGSHTYADPGSNAIQVTIHHETAPDATATSTATVTAMLSNDAWTGAAGDGLWTTPGNWSAGVPAVTSAVSISGNVTVNVPAGAYVVGSLDLGSGATLNFPLDGTHAGIDYAMLDVADTATLNGTLSATLATSYTPMRGDSYQPLIYGTESGTPTVDVPAGEEYFLTPTSLYVVPNGSTSVLVTNTASSGTGSLSEAISVAALLYAATIDSTPGASPAELITFNIPTSDPGYNVSSGVWTIPSAMALSISFQAIIDGTTQPGYAGKPVIQLSGTNTSSGVSGLELTGGHSRVTGLAIDGFSGDAIDISGTGFDALTANFLGTDPTGTVAVANGGDGVDLTGVSNNVIGGTMAAEQNVISGNNGAGVFISGSNSSANMLLGNIIGANATGSAALGNSGNGVEIAGGATNNTIGGTAAGEGNVISSNGGGKNYVGLLIDGSGTSNNLVEGNFIGTNAAGTVALGNSLHGVAIQAGASGNIIGGTTTGARNVISGNGADGVFLSGTGTSGNAVEGNYIGTDFTGASALPNADSGIAILANAATNTIGGTVAAAANAISGNAGDGVFISGSGTSGNLIEGNFIGTDTTGNAALGNSGNGVEIDGGATNNTIGGTARGDGNVISGNGGGKNYSGVFIHDAGTSGNVVAGNLIGTGGAGTAVLANSLNGVDIEEEATGNTIGGTTAGARNVISGNGQDGVLLLGTGVSGNLIEGNSIGTDLSGANGLANAKYGVAIVAGAANNTVGGSAAGAANTVAFNKSDGVLVDAGAGNLVSQNSIFSSGHLGIELTNNGNNNQAAPVLNSVTSSGGGTTVTGSLTGAANAKFTLEFFANATGNQSGFGEGQTFLGTTSVTTNAQGTYDFVANLPTALPASERIVAATATDTNNDTSSFSKDVTAALLPINAAAAGNVTAVEGASFTAAVATFTDPNGATALSDYSATIAWGDGHNSAGTISGPDANGVFTVSGTNSYAEEGVKSPVVTITHDSSQAVTTTASISVSDPSVVATPGTLTAVEGAASTINVATFADAGGTESTANYGATILWGDGSTSAGSIGVSNGVFTVSGTNTYAEDGVYTVTATITHDAAPPTTVTAAVAVSEAPIAGSGATLNGTAGETVFGNLATFTHGQSGEAADDFTATIDWGDGSSSAGTVSQAGGTYTVAGSHTYSAGGTFSIQVTILDDGVSTPIDSSAVIAATGTPHERYVTAVYEDVLARTPDPGGLAYWSSLLDQGAAVSSVAESIAHSAEYYANFVIQPTYLKLLGRAADDAGVQYWTVRMQNGLTDQDLEASFVASDEFFNNAGGGTNPVNWIDAVYKLLLGRTADASGETYWNNRLTALMETEDAADARLQVALGIAGSQENNTNLINADYFHYLGRAADPGGLAYWLQRFADGATNEDVIAGFTGSAEYYKDKTGVSS